MRVDPVLRGRQEDGHHRRVRRTPDSSPAVSVIIPACNAEATIADTLDSVLTQDYDGPVAVTVADGSDGPATAETVRRVAPTAQIVPNPDQHTPAGLNAAIRATHAPIVVRVDAHVKIPPGYLRRITATLARTGAANVGGRQQPIGSSFFTRAVAVAQTTLLGTGNARYRQGGVEGATDTVYLGAFRRDAVEAVGGFDDALRCNQDYDLNWRLRQRGETIWFDPALVVMYRPRQDLRRLARQYFDYGRWKRVMLRRHPRSLRLRQLAAPLLVLGLAASAGLAGAGAKGAGAVVPLTYLGTLAVWSLAVGAWRREPAALILPMVLAAMHLSWGIGFFVPVRPRPFPPPRPDPTKADKETRPAQRKTDPAKE